jgi:protein TonB
MMHVKIKMPVPISDPRGFTIPPTIIPNPPVKSATTKVEQSINRNLLEKVVTHDVELAPVKPVETILPGAETGTNTGLPAEGVVLGKGDEVVPVVIDLPTCLVFAEVMPEYVGGPSAMMRFLGKNLHYPPSARAIGQEGTIYVRFVVNNAGQVVDVEVVKGVSAVLDREAIRVVALMKKWKPGRQHDIPVNVRMVLPIRFHLERE